MGRQLSLPHVVKIDKKAVLSQREPRDAAVKFDTYRNLKRHCAVSLPQHGFLVYISDRSNAEIACTVR